MAHERAPAEVAPVHTESDPTTSDVSLADRPQLRKGRSFGGLPVEIRERSMERVRSPTTSRTSTPFEDIVVAAAYVNDAFAGRFSNGRAKMLSEPNSFTRLCFDIQTSSRFAHFYNLVCIAHMLMVLVEPTCYRDASVDGNYMRPFYEIVFILVYASDIYMKARYFGWKSYFTKPWHRRIVFVVSVVVVDFMANCAFGLRLQFARMLRPVILVIRYRPLRRVYETIAAMLPHLRDIALAFVLFITIFAIIGVRLYEGEYPDHSFDDFLLAYRALFVLITTENYPDIAYPGYDAHNSSLIYFIIFFLFGVIFLTGLVLAIVVREYKVYHRSVVKKELQKERKALTKAFILLDPEKKMRIEYNDWKTMIKLAFPSSTTTSEDLWRVRWETLDSDSNEYLTLFEFFELNDVMHLSTRWFYTERRNASQWCRTVKEIVESKRFARGVYYLILCNTVVLAAYHHNLSKGGDLALRIVDLLFVMAFMAELGLKIYAYGFANFIKQGWNGFDFVVVVPAFFIRIASFAGSDHSPLLESIAAFRTFRLFSDNAELKIIYVVLARVFPMMVDVVGFSVMFMYMYAILGMELMCGKFEVPGNAEFLAADHLATFSSFGEAFFSLFQILTTSNWHDIMYAADEGVGSPWISIYFILYYIVSVMILLNLLTALIIFAHKMTVDYIEQNKGLLSTKISYQADDVMDRATEAVKKHTRSPAQGLRRARSAEDVLSRERGHMSLADALGASRTSLDPALQSPSAARSLSAVPPVPASPTGSIGSSGLTRSSAQHAPSTAPGDSRVPAKDAPNWTIRFLRWLDILHSDTDPRERHIEVVRLRGNWRRDLVREKVQSYEGKELEDFSRIFKKEGYPDENVSVSALKDAQRTSSVAQYQKSSSGGQKRLDSLAVAMADQVKRTESQRMSRRRLKAGIASVVFSNRIDALRRAAGAAGAASAASPLPTVKEGSVSPESSDAGQRRTPGNASQRTGDSSGTDEFFTPERDHEMVPMMWEGGDDIAYGAEDSASDGSNDRAGAS